MTDAEQALEAAAVDVESAAELFGLTSAAAFGKWHDYESVTLTDAPRDCAIKPGCSALS